MEGGKGEGKEGGKDQGKEKGKEEGKEEGEGPFSVPFTFGCFNALAKCSGGVWRVWARILNLLPEARLLIKAKSFACEYGRDFVLTCIATHLEGGKEEAKRRVDCVPLVPSNFGHLACYNQVDLALDPFPYAGE